VVLLIARAMCCTELKYISEFIGTTFFLAGVVTLLQCTLGVRSVARCAMIFNLIKLVLFSITVNVIKSFQRLDPRDSQDDERFCNLQPATDFTLRPRTQRRTITDIPVQHSVSRKHELF